MMSQWDALRTSCSLQGMNRGVTCPQCGKRQPSGWHCVECGQKQRLGVVAKTYLWWGEQGTPSKAIYLWMAALVVILISITDSHSLSRSGSQRSTASIQPSAASGVTTTSLVTSTTTEEVRLAADGHRMRLCGTPLKNRTNYSCCYWRGAEKAPGNDLNFNKSRTFDETPIVGSNFTYANLSYGIPTTDPSGTYAMTENSAVTIRPLHDCILVNTTFAVDIQEMQAFNSLPLDAMDFTGSTIGGNTLKGSAGRWVNFSNANLSDANLAGSTFTNVIGSPPSLPPHWIVDANKDIVRSP